MSTLWDSLFNVNSLGCNWLFYCFSPGNSILFGNLAKMFIELPTDAVVGGIPEALFAMFQMTFCIITPALVIGSYVERIKFSVVLLFSSLWLIFVTAQLLFGYGEEDS